MTAREIDPEATYTSENAEALMVVFERMPEACQRMVLVAARRPGTWIPYDVAEKEAGLRPKQFQSAFGGYRSHDRLRERPFRIGHSPRGRFALKVDENQAFLLLGLPST